eukprot:3399043-Pleurochrysis_carterae.AAC.2
MSLAQQRLFGSNRDESNDIRIRRGLGCTSRICDGRLAAPSDSLSSFCLFRAICSMQAVNS